ncbi:MAG: Asp23/Gls24 family envelope stress response protein [Actinomycetota bacterium]|nr:Asp23/Gls24 family envelope stress response protein [Actinomycetota bacterium]
MTTTDPAPSKVASVVAGRAATVAGVVRLDAGPFGTRSTYGSGGRVDGVTVKTGAGADPAQVTVHIVVRFGERIPELAETVSRAVSDALRAELGAAGRWQVGVEVVDVVAAEAELAGDRRRELP